jgi:hypothetical protein
MLRLREDAVGKKEGLYNLYPSPDISGLQNPEEDGRNMQYT